MVTAPADQQRPLFLAAALFAVALTILGTRSIKSAGALIARPLPLADLDAISSFLRPLPETLSEQVNNGSVGVNRDPFGPAGMVLSRTPVVVSGTAVTRKPTAAQPWLVSTILVEGSQRAAIVNEVWVTVGDSLAGGARVTAVERDHIVVTDAKGIRHNVPVQGGEMW
jgi:hypothetical protein